MKIVADEGIEGPIVLRLRAQGHHVIHIAEVASGSTGSEILEFANREEALLITYDKDFGDLVFYLYHRTHGVILVRLPNDLTSSEKADIVVAVISVKQEELFHSFTVIALNKKRTIRILPKNYPEAD